MISLPLYLQDKQNKEEEGLTLPEINKGLEPSPGSEVRIIIEHCETPTIDDEEDVTTKELRKTSEQPKLKWHERYALQKHKKWRWPKKKRELLEGEDGEEIHEENDDERVVCDDKAKFNGEVETENKEEEEDENTEMTEEEKEVVMIYMILYIKRFNYLNFTLSKNSKTTRGCKL